MSVLSVAPSLRNENGYHFQLLNTVKSLPDADIKELARTCGYLSTRKDGTQKLNFTDFYIALLTAKANQY